MVGWSWGCGGGGWWGPFYRFSSTHHSLSLSLLLAAIPVTATFQPAHTTALPRVASPWQGMEASLGQANGAVEAATPRSPPSSPGGVSGRERALSEGASGDRHAASGDPTVGAAVPPRFSLQTQPFVDRPQVASDGSLVIALPPVEASDELPARGPLGVAADVSPAAAHTIRISSATGSFVGERPGQPAGDEWWARPASPSARCASPQYSGFSTEEGVPFSDRSARSAGSELDYSDRQSESDTGSLENSTALSGQEWCQCRLLHPYTYVSSHHWPLAFCSAARPRCCDTLLAVSRRNVVPGRIGCRTGGARNELLNAGNRHTARFHL